MSRWRRARVDEWRQRREIQWALGASNDAVGDPEGLMVTRRPLTPLEALMECAPHQTPETSSLALLALREVLQDAIEELEPRQKWVFDSYVNRGLSFLEIADEISVSQSTAHRVYNEATEALQRRLIDHPMVREYLDLGDDE